MTKLSILGLSAGTALLCALPVSLQWSQDGLSVSLDKANAVIGRPLTPGSVAGVNRRVHRRAARRAYYHDVAYGDSTPYYNRNWGYAPGYGATAVGVAATRAAAASTPYNNWNHPVLGYGNWGAWNGAGPGYGVARVGGIPATEAAASHPYTNASWGAWNGAGPGYGVAAATLPARAAAARAAYYGAGYGTGYSAGALYSGAVYPARAVYSAGYIPPSYFGPVCNPHFDASCQ